MHWISTADSSECTDPSALVSWQSASHYLPLMTYSLSMLCVNFLILYNVLSVVGIAHCRFVDSGNHYTWRKVTTTVHNIIVGKLWVDNHGEMDICNHKTGDKCHLKFSAYSYFSKDVPRKVSMRVASTGSGTGSILLSNAENEHGLLVHLTV